MTSLIEEKEVTAVQLSLALEQAVIEHELEEDGTIQVNEDGWYPFWISINPRTGYVHFRTHTCFRKLSSLLQRLELCNELNLHNYLFTAALQEDRLLLDHVLSYRSGLLRENVIRGCRQFARNIARGLGKTDPDNKVVLLPGQTESEDEAAA